MKILRALLVLLPSVFGFTCLQPVGFAGYSLDSMFSLNGFGVDLLLLGGGWKPNILYNIINISVLEY